MSVNLQTVIGNEWKERLGLSTRGKPELYESANEVTESPHAGAIRTAFDDLGPGFRRLDNPVYQHIGSGMKRI